MQLSKLDRQDKIARREAIRKLFYVRNQLLKDKNMSQLLTSLITLLQSEFNRKRVNIELFFNCMMRVSIYAECYFELPQERFNVMQVHLLNGSKRVANFLKNQDQKSFDSFDKKAIASLQEFKDGTFTEKTIMYYTKWVLNIIRKETQLNLHILRIISPFYVYVIFAKPMVAPKSLEALDKICLHRFYQESGVLNNLLAPYLQLRYRPYRNRTNLPLSYYKDKLVDITLQGVDALLKKDLAKFLDIFKDKNKSRTNDYLKLVILHAIVFSIDDIIEEYIEVLKPSSYFLESLKELLAKD